MDSIETFRREHDSVRRLLLVLGSTFARLHEGEPCDEPLLLDLLRYLDDYLEAHHGPREDRVLAAAEVRVAPAVLHELGRWRAAAHAAGASLRERLERALADDLVARSDLVGEGLDYCSSVRRCMVVEEVALFPFVAPLSETEAARLPVIGADDGYREVYEALTHQAGCGCSYA